MTDLQRIVELGEATSSEMTGTGLPIGSVAAGTGVADWSVPAGKG